MLLPILTGLSHHTGYSSIMLSCYKDKKSFVARCITRVKTWNADADRACFNACKRVQYGESWFKLLVV